MKRYICEGIVKGATHVRNQMPCQDNKKIIKISDEITIIALADGHGSSKCPRSDRGSMIAVNSFYHIMKKYLEIYGEDEEDITHLMTFLNREGDVRFAQDVCEEWQARVKQSFYKNKVEGMTNEDGSIKWPSVFSLYGTTLLGMLITDSFVFSFQIGDGDISAVTKDEVRAIGRTGEIPWYRNSFIIETRCLEKSSYICTPIGSGKPRILYVYSIYRRICQQLHIR